MSLDFETVRRIAHLARIRVEDDELPKLAAELNTILGWVEQLAALDVAEIPPLTGPVSMALRMREDVIDDGGIPEKVLANAPERLGDYFVVPKVVE
jgi:aspartyl-tRNA(Asn)/glutamyl-tRNA(Gln) amidotransferase subunit C